MALCVLDSAYINYASWGIDCHKLYELKDPVSIIICNKLGSDYFIITANNMNKEKTVALLDL